MVSLATNALGKTLLTGFFFLTLGVNALASDCSQCGLILQKIQQNMNSKAQYKALLEKNRQYLASLPNNATSKKIKINSNVLLISVNLETVENNLQLLKSEAQKRRCDQCSNLILR